MKNYIIKKYPIDNISIFEIENFLSEDLYKKIKKNFNNYLSDIIDSRQLLDKKNSKYCFNSRMKIYEKMKNKYIEIKELDDIVQSKEFCGFLFKKFFFEILKSRKNNLSQLLRVFKIPNLVKFNETENDKISELDDHGHQKIVRKFNKKFNLLDLIYNDIEVTTEYSYIFNKGKIVPHTDDVDKIFSLMLYFPQFDTDLKSELKNQEKKIGTVFWNSTNKNFNNKHLEGFSEKKFEDENKNILILPFKGKTLFGFIKNDLSWHSVREFDLSEKYVRCSININFRFT